MTYDPGRDERGGVDPLRPPAAHGEGLVAGGGGGGGPLAVVAQTALVGRGRGVGVGSLRDDVGSCLSWCRCFLDRRSSPLRLLPSSAAEGPEKNIDFLLD